MGGDKPDNMSTVVGPRDEGPGGHVGPYKLLGRLGEGGFGIVYEAERARASPAFDALRRHPRYLSLQARHQAVKAPVAP